MTGCYFENLENIVISQLKRTQRSIEAAIAWPLDETMTDDALENLLFPKEKSATNKRMPDYAYIRKELLRNGVSKKLLWSEYCEDCHMAGEEPLFWYAG